MHFRSTADTAQEQHQKNTIQQICTFQSNQIKFQNQKSSLPLKRFIFRFLTTLNSRKPKSDKIPSSISR